MGPSEDTGQDTAYAHDRHRTRHGRHGRPGPFGGRLRLPTLRFSGAAMAMSTVVGISIATTFLLSEQQGVGRRAGVARVGSSAPPPSPATDPDTASGTTSGPATASGTTADRDTGGPATTAGRPPSAPTAPLPGAAGPTAGAPDGTPGPRSATPAAPRGGAPSGVPLAEGPPPRHGVTGEPAGPHPGGTGTGGTGTGAETLAGGQPTEEQLAARDAERQPLGRPAEESTPTAPAPTTPSPSPTAPRPFLPTPGAPEPPPREWTGEVLGTTPDTVDGAGTAVTKSGSGGTGSSGGGREDADDQALTGAALVQPLGRDGTRHLLALTVTEPLTALQAEFRLSPGALAPGTGTAWTDLAGAVITTHHERGAAVYRFTTAPGTDVRPGQYTFAVRGTRSPAVRPTAPGPSRTPAPRGGGPRTAEPRSSEPRTTEPRTTESRASEPRTAESWNASAFGIDRPRAVAALGGFAPPTVTGPAVPAPRASVPTPAPVR